MKTNGTFVLAVLALFYVSVHAEDLTPAPERKPNDTWTYHSIDGSTKLETDVFSITVKDAKLEGYVFVWESVKTGMKYERTSTRDLNPVVLAQGRVYAPYYPYFKFPLSVGKTWSEESTLRQESDNTKWTYSTTGKVVRFGKVTVPAGEFEAYEISVDATYTGERQGSRNWSGRRMETLWYAPAVKTVVKQQYDDFQTSSFSHPSTTELQSYTLQ